ncbi:hypothetical protein SEA_ALEEMILY_143 [Gordonia phage Aleemily]|uniref:Uncharacterized protein n=1 Tax=Gordonia phage Aleemily TaxID=2965181 RepID=A0A9E7QBQ9_9CAUD|nr:hypothetical protein SEA_ALEEMILY_143 [Gordonia phage Aleemily]
MYPTDDSACNARQLIERRIVRHLVDEILGHDLWIGVHDGEEQHPITRDREAILDALINTDEDYVRLFGQGQHAGPPLGWVRLVYGNDGYDVICDYVVGIEHLIAKTNALADEIMDEEHAKSGPLFRVFFLGGSYADTREPQKLLAEQDPFKPQTRVVAIVDHYITTDAGIGDAHRAVAEFMGWPL